MTTGENIKRIRIKRNMTQKELGEKLGGISQQQIGQWETGKVNPKIETIQKIAHALNVDWNIFITENYIEKREKEIDTLLNQSEAIKLAGKAFDDPYVENMLLSYSLLNEKGKREAFNRIEELTEVPRYTKKEE